MKALIGLALYCIGGMATNMTMGILAPIMQSYPNVSPVVVQTVLVGPPLIGTIFAFLFGPLNKKIPAKAIMIFAQVMLLLYGLIFMLTGGKAPIGMLIFGSGLAGFNQGSLYTAYGLILVDSVPDERKRATLFGVYSALMSIGGVLFTTLGGVVAAGGWQKAYLLFLYYIPAIVLELFLLPNHAPEGKEAPAPQAAAEAAPEDAPKAQMGRVWFLSIHYFFFFLWLYVFGTNVSEFIMNTYKIGGSAEAGLAASCVTIGGIFSGFLFGAYSKVLKRATVPVLMGASVIGLALPCFITTSLVGIYFAGLLLGFAMMGANPYIMNFMHELAPGAAYGKALSVYNGFMNAGMVVAIYIITFLTQLFFGDGTYIHGKFVVALVGDIIVFALSFLVYMPRTKANK